MIKIPVVLFHENQREYDAPSSDAQYMIQFKELVPDEVRRHAYVSSFHNPRPAAGVVRPSEPVRGSVGGVAVTLKIEQS